MEAVNSVDRVVHLLRQRLEARERASRKGSGLHAPTSDRRGVEALAAAVDVDDRQLRRTFVQTVLADQLGPQLINDAQFQQIVSRVSDAIEDDAAATELLTQLVAELRRRAI